MDDEELIGMDESDAVDTGDDSIDAEMGDENAVDQPFGEVDEPVPIETRVPPVVKIVEVDNPEYVSYNVPLKNMIRTFAEDHCNIPSITYETMHPYLCNLVEKIYQAKQAKMDERVLQMRFLVGFSDDVLRGFMMCTMLPQRLPHISTLEITYIYSENIHVTSAFISAIARYKKLWRAKHLSCIAVNDKVRKALEKILTGYRLCGYYVYGFSPKHKAVENFVQKL